MTPVKKWIEDMTGSGPEALKESQAELAVLVQMANYKLDAAEEQLRKKILNKEIEGKIEIVGDRLGDFIRDYRVRQDDGEIGPGVQGILDEIGTIGDASAQQIITKTISNALKAVFAVTASAESEQHRFMVVFEKVAVVRYDYYVFKYQASVSGVFKHAKSVVAFMFARSVVDHSRVSDDELNDAIVRSMGANATPEEVLAYRQKLMALWESTKAKPVHALVAELHEQNEAIAARFDRADRSAGVLVR